MILLYLQTADNRRLVYAAPAGVSDAASLRERVCADGKRDNRDTPRRLWFTRYRTDDCVPPYVIAEEAATEAVNLAKVRFLAAAEGEALPRAVYECRLREAVARVCVHCVHFGGDMEDLTGHRDEIDLDGRCGRFLAR